MCGIAGVISKEPITSTHLAHVAEMSRILTHRGPDSEGAYNDEHIIVGVRRLSIIDTQGGTQPLYNEDRSLVLIANGEIYNFVELRRDLEAKGHRFRTGSDCETILHLYEDFGVECLSSLRGMFAFALWDARRRRLLLARDRMGEKPLYIYQRKGELFFSSELKALIKSRITPFDLDPTAVNLFFHYEYVPEPLTPIRNVGKLPAAHYWVVDVDDWQITEKCYWRMEDAPPLTGDPAQLIRGELETVSDLVLRSDVPVGIALSGGIDSSALASLTTRKSKRELHAFCVGYPDSPDGDERAAAQQFAKHLHLPFHQVELRTADLVDFFPQLIHCTDDLIADPSSYGYYSVMKLAREHNVPVVLQGQGGDELFWGYPWVKQAVNDSERKAHLLRKDFRAIIDYFRPLILRGGRLRDGWRDLRRDVLAPANRLVFYDLVPDFIEADHRVNNFYTKLWRNEVHDSAQAFFTLSQPWHNLNIKFTRMISQMYLLANGIAQGDRLSMASSVELRLPLVDYRLIETVIGLRKTYPDHLLSPKAWLKNALVDVVPEWVLNRPKRGFAPPVSKWSNALFAAYGTLLRDGLLVEMGLLTASAARELSLGDRPPKSVSPLSFKSLVLEIWARELS